MDEQEKKKLLLAELFEVDVAQLEESKPLSELRWDSVLQLGTIVLFKAEFGLKLAPERVRGYVRVGDILADMPSA